MQITSTYCDICKKEVRSRSQLTLIRLPLDDINIKNRVKEEHSIITADKEICDECAFKIIDALEEITKLRRKRL